MNQKTWETIVEPEKPILFSDLEVHVTKGESLDIGRDYPELHQEVLQYWNGKVAEAAIVRAHDLSKALTSGDDKTVRRLMRFIGGVDSKHRLSRAILDDERLHLALGATDYMHFIGTNERAINDPEFRKRLIQAGIENAADPDKYFANPLAVCTVIYCKDPHSGEEYVPIGLRSDKVMIYPGVHHVFGGLVDVNETRTKVSLSKNVRRELKEEIGLEEEEIGAGYFNGIIKQGPSRIPEAICALPVFVNKNALIDRWKFSTPDKFEHRNITFYQREELPAFLDQYGATMVPSGAAALTAFLKHKL